MSVKVLVTFFIFLVAVQASPLSNAKGIQLKNTGKQKLWIIMTGEESFILPEGQVASVLLEQDWSGTIYAKSAECQYEKCETPYSAAEFQFGIKNEEDHYRVSLKEGFNIPITIQSTNPFEFCKSATCVGNILEQCPQDHQVTNTNKTLVACKPNADIFRKLCPNAVTSNDDEISNTLICKKSNTYQVLFG